MDYINIETAYEPAETPALGIRNKGKVEINLNDKHYEATADGVIHNVPMINNVMAIAPMEMFEPIKMPVEMVPMVPAATHMGVVTTFYLGSISVVGLYIFYRILNK